jgi:DNA topoisomerase-2
MKPSLYLEGIPKLDDANDAGGKNSELCTLILTVGPASPPSKRNSREVTRSI